MNYTVSLDNFSGPLDLLLFLVKKEEVAIHDVPISTICDRYLEYIKALEFLDVDLSSEFLVMASTMMLIKSRALLPIEDEIDLEEELDPEDELIQQLLEYKRYKVASRDLSEMADIRSRIYPIAPPKPAQVGVEEKEIELEDLDLWDLVKAFADLLKETGLHRMPRLIKESKPLRAYIEDVFKAVRMASRISFKGLFVDVASRETVVGRFIAILELVRRGRITVTQSPGGVGQEIELEIADQRDLSEAEIDEMEANLQADESADDDEETSADGAESLRLPDFVDAEEDAGQSPDPKTDGDDPPAVPRAERPRPTEGEDGTERVHIVP